MSLSNKGYKTLNHRDVQYRWLMKNRSGINEVSIYANAAIGGQELIAELPRVVTLTMVTEAIDFGIANGWKPNEAGKLLRCRRARNGFSFSE
jgi:hypothetical protein